MPDREFQGHKITLPAPLSEKILSFPFMLLVYLPEDSARARYVIRHIFRHLFPTPYLLTGSGKEFLAHQGPKFLYGREQLNDNQFFIKAEDIVFETEIKEISPLVIKGRIYTGKKPSEFDPIAAIFFLLSRYEEYFTAKTDYHGRYLPESSVIFQHQLEHIPLVEKYAAELVEKLESWFPGQLKYSRPRPKAFITVDVDSAYAYLYKPWYRQMINMARSLMKREAVSPFAVYTGKSKDPYDSYDYLQEKERETGLTFKYFFLLGRWSKYDKNISPRHPVFRKLIQHLSKGGKGGIHPSYYSSEEPEKLEREIGLLSDILQAPVTASRQHYLRFRLPKTYHKLIQYGIREEYSMGYAGRLGFRASTCSPFYWFDLENNAETELKVFPVTYMDNCLSDYMGLDPEEALEKIASLAKTVYDHHGVFIPIWHNHTVNDYGKFKGWKKVFEDNLRLLKEMGYA
jgi:hypothetical protein